MKKRKTKKNSENKFKKKKIKKDFEKKESESVEKIEEGFEKETLDELIRKNILKEIKEKTVNGKIIIDDVSAPVLENIAERQKIMWTREKEQERKERSLINYSTGESINENSKYDESPKNFNQNNLRNSNLNINLAGTNSETRNPRIIFNTPESKIREKDLINFEENYFNPENFRHKDDEIFFGKQEKKYREFKPNK